MTAVPERKSSFLSIEDYLQLEESAAGKHEYLAGRVYAMVGGRYAHNLIATNVCGELHSQLRGKPCRVLNSDSKLKIDIGTQTRFYYPDATVVCGRDVREDVFQDRPTAVVEVMSESTRRIDETEKTEAYLTVPSLAYCLLIEQSIVGAVLYRRTDAGFERIVYSSATDVIDLPLIGCRLPLSAVYADVPFSNAEGDAESD